jgi:predicted flap endonuclease-1-like 5' DNA nuclease
LIRKECLCLFNLNPWLALLLGILIGWLLEWLLELWFFRRRRLACQRRLAQVEADLRTKEIELRNARAHADSLQADLTARAIARPAIESGVVAARVPAIESVVEPVRVPAIERVAVSERVPAIESGVVAARVSAIESVVEPVRVPAIERVAVSERVPAIESGVVAARVPAIERAFEPERVPAIERVAEVKVEAPEVEVTAPIVELPTVEAERPAVTVEAPQVEVTAPVVALPQVEPPKVELPVVEAELPAVTVEAPQVEVTAPVVELPKIEPPQVELPEAGLAAAAGAGLIGLGGKLAAEAPVAERSVNWTAAVKAEPETPRIEVDWPQVGGAVAEVGATLPEAQPLAAEIQAPSIGAELPAAIGVTAGAVSLGLPEAAVEATKVAVAESSVNWTAVPAEPEGADDLELIEGIGPVYAAKLQAAGIVTFAQLAATDEAQLARIVAAPSWRKTNYAEWIAQARLAAAGDEAGLTALQAELFKRHGDHLDLIAGIGSRTAEVLGAAGITSFALLSETTPEKLDAIIKKADARGGDYQAWIAEAGQRAARKGAPRLRKTRAAAHVTACPQDLSKLRGIGSVYEQKLYAAGIGTFWQLSQAADADLTRILGVKDFQNVNLTEIKAAAAKKAEDTGTVGHIWDGSQPDDFEPLGGIGQVYEGRLYDAGICTYTALATATVEQLAAICKAPAWRMPDYAGWIAQAAARVAKGK